jgi:GNAT superfamily N-acetyltransferase
MIQDRLVKVSQNFKPLSYPEGAIQCGEQVCYNNNKNTNNNLYKQTYSERFGMPEGTYEPGNFTVREINGLEMRNYNLNSFIQTIYKNFIYLREYPILNHNPKEIHKELVSPNMIGYFLYNGHKMVGYTVAQVMRLNDGRLVLYINYLYVASNYRSKGFGSILLKRMINKALTMHLDAIILICDTLDEKIFDFYMLKGFMYDPYLRRYDRHDVLSLNLN